MRAQKLDVSLLGVRSVLCPEMDACSKVNCEASEK